MNSKNLKSIFSNGIKTIKKYFCFVHAFLCTIAQGAMTWFSLEHFFSPLHINNHYVRDSFAVIRGILTGASSITAALTRGTEMIFPRNDVIVPLEISKKKKILSSLGYWGIGWSASWFIFFTFFTIIYSILPEEDEPASGFEEAFSIFVAISVRHGFMIEIVSRLRESITSFDKAYILTEAKKHPIKISLTTITAGIFSVAQSYRIYSITSESLHLLAKMLINSKLATFISIGNTFRENIHSLCCFSASTIGLSTYLAYLPEIYKRMINDEVHRLSTSERFALNVVYLDALIAAIENSLIIADLGLNLSNEEYAEFLSYLAIIAGFTASFYAARSFNSAAEENIKYLFKSRPQVTDNQVEENSPLLLIN